jgi:hypothetical protein
MDDAVLMAALRLALAVLASAAVTAGCLPATQFDCTTSSQCGHGGVCEPEGVCGFPDATCTSGFRFGSLSGSDANQCVGASNPSCDGFSPLSGVTGHLYQSLDAATKWGEARSSCAGMGGFLAVPAAQDEVDAIVTANGADTWIGIQENGNSGSFSDVNGSTPSFLPWEAGQPSGAANGCVIAHGSDDAYALANCNESNAATCQCDP